jgi:hypothetical protein
MDKGLVISTVEGRTRKIESEEYMNRKSRKQRGEVRILAITTMVATR